MTQLDRESAIVVKDGIVAARRRAARELTVPKNEIRIIETSRSAADTNYRLELKNGRIIGWVEESCVYGTALLVLNED